MSKMFRSFLAFIVALFCTVSCIAQGAYRNHGNQNYGSTFGNHGFGHGMIGAVAPEYAFGFFLVGALVGAFFSQRFKPYRKWIVTALAAIAGVIFLTMGAPFAYLGWLVFGFIIAWLLLRVATAMVKKAKSTLFGSATWADRAHLQARKLVGTAGLWLGTFRDSNGPLDLHYRGDRHLLLIAPTRSGKGVSCIIPNLLTYSGSVIVIDPKGENAMITADFRRNVLGQDVFVVDPWGITGQPVARFNPIDWLTGDDPDVDDNALQLAEAIVVRKEGNADPFWDDEAVALLWGLIMYVAVHPAAPERTLGAVRDIITGGPQYVNTVLTAMAESGNLVMESTAARTLAKEEKLRANVFSTLQSHTHFLDSKRMRENMAASDFRFEDLKQGNVTIYLVLPAKRLNAFGRWLRLLITQSIAANAETIGTQPEKPTLFVLDEMAALGRLKMVEEAFGLMAGFGIQLWGVAQDASQLKRIYGDGWETFVANAGVLQYFGSRDDKTSSYFSRLCGVGTEEKVSFSTSTSHSAQGGSFSKSTSTDQIARQLALPDELMRVDEHKQILLIENNDPIIAEKLVWYEDPRLMDRGVNLKKKAA